MLDRHLDFKISLPRIFGATFKDVEVPPVLVTLRYRSYEEAFEAPGPDRPDATLECNGPAMAQEDLRERCLDFLTHPAVSRFVSARILSHNVPTANNLFCNYFGLLPHKTCLRDVFAQEARKGGKVPPVEITIRHYGSGRETVEFAWRPAGPDAAESGEPKQACLDFLVSRHAAPQNESGAGDAGL